MKFDLNEARPAVLVIDLQGLFSGAESPFGYRNTDKLIAHVNSFTKDCDEMGLPVIYSRYLFRDDLSDAGLLATNSVVRQGHMSESSEWMELDHRLQLPQSKIMLQRNRPGAFWNGSLADTLTQNSIDSLILCGLSVNNAISTTAREAFALDIPTVIVKECVGAAPWEKNMEIYLDILNTWTAEVASSEDILQRLKKSDPP